jgi:uncharacterized protein YeaC (DUF1315 family)
MKTVLSILCLILMFTAGLQASTAKEMTKYKESLTVVTNKQQELRSQLQQLEQRKNMVQGILLYLDGQLKEEQKQAAIANKKAVEKLKAEKEAKIVISEEQALESEELADEEVV